jgi:hypothetical protein
LGVLRGRSARLVAILAPVSVAWACTLFNPLDEYGPKAAKGPDAGQPAIDAADTCAHARWPERPTTNGGDENLELVFAIDRLQLTAPTETATSIPAGFDLDDRCTCPGPGSCVVPAGLPEACDLDGGIDFNGTRMLQSFLTRARREDDATEGIRQGIRGVLFQLARYNGSPNDPEVELGIYGSSGTVRDGGAPVPPLHDGNDRWLVDRETLFGGGGPPFVARYVDTRAYVANGVLVAKIDFPLTFGELQVSLVGTTIVANVTNASGAFRLDNGRLTGRWPTDRLLVSLDTLKDPFNPSGGICGTSVIYRDLKREVCAAVDLASDPSEDGKGAPCTALGLTAFFSAERAKFGEAYDRIPPPRRCGDTWTDSCATP